MAAGTNDRYQWVALTNTTAAIFLLPLTAGFLVAGPTSGFLSDRFGSRGIATAGMAVFGGSFIGLMLLPVDFPYWAFALLIAANGIGGGRHPQRKREHDDTDHDRHQALGATGGVWLAARCRES